MQSVLRWDVGAKRHFVMETAQAHAFAPPQYLGKAQFQNGRLTSWALAKRAW